MTALIMFPALFLLIFLGFPVAFSLMSVAFVFGYLTFEMAAFFQAKFAKFGELQPDAETIIGLAQNEDYMNAVGATYAGKCASCHGPDGGGIIGPNLTDDSYIHVNEPSDIHTVLLEGVTNKGMPAWGRQLHPNELVLLSAYVAKMRDEDVAGREPEGEVIPPWPDHPRLTFEEEDAPAPGG